MILYCPIRACPVLLYFLPTIVYYEYRYLCIVLCIKVKRVTYRKFISNCCWSRMCPVPCFMAFAFPPQLSRLWHTYGKAIIDIPLTLSFRNKQGKLRGILNTLFGVKVIIKGSFFAASREQLRCRESTAASGEEACPQANWEVLVRGRSGKRWVHFLKEGAVLGG